MAIGALKSSLGTFDDRSVVQLRKTEPQLVLHIRPIITSYSMECKQI